MNSQRKPFRLNKEDGKVLGVCAGIADHFDTDVTLVRVAMALTIFFTFPVVLLAYLLVAMIARDGGRSRSAAPQLSQAGMDATRERMRALDARMAAIETYVTSSNTSLAREIDELR